MRPSWQTHPDRALKILRKMRILIQDHPEYGLCAAFAASGCGEPWWQMEDIIGIRKPFRAQLRQFWYSIMDTVILLFSLNYHKGIFDLQYWWPRVKANGEPNAEPRLRAINKAIERVQRHLHREIQKHLNQ